MMQKIRLPGQYLPWLFLLLFVDGFAALLLWIVNAPAFFSILLVILIFTVLMFDCVCALLVSGDRKKERAFLEFIAKPDTHREEELIRMISFAQGKNIRALGGLLRQKQRAYMELLARTEDYEEYVESWAHEIKMPLALLSFLLDNRRDELSETVSFKLAYSLSRMQESVDQMLFYARLKGVKKDYLFERIVLSDCVKEVLEDYRPLLLEKGFQVSVNLSDETVCADWRGLRFLLGQIVSNSVKYCEKEPKLWFAAEQTKEAFILTVKDNGIGVLSCDLPYIFEKGFTGNSGENRKHATGMGLYLAQGIAKDLNLSLEADAGADGESGFSMRIFFPAVDCVSAGEMSINALQR